MSRAPHRVSYRGFYLRFGDVIDVAANREVHRVTSLLLANPLPGVTDLLPAYSSLYLEYDARLLGEAQVRNWLERSREDVGAVASGREVYIPVRYDGEDLAGLAELTGMSRDEVVALHAGTAYRVFAMGFTPGFPFMGEVAAQIRTPRLSSPRKRVPAHSVATAGAQSGIYPLPSPGGWRLLGTALTSVYDPHREEPFLLRPGDSVRFEDAGSAGSLGRPPDPEPLQLLPEEPERPLLLVREAGLLDLVVDRGRFLSGRFGLSRSGPLDPRSAAIANALVANSPDAPLLEVNVSGPILESLAGGVAAFAGWGVVPRLNGQTLEPFTSFELRQGDVLSLSSAASAKPAASIKTDWSPFGSLESGWMAEGPAPAAGCRGYLALAGGIESRRFMGSAATDLRGLIGLALKEGDRLGVAGKSSAVAGRAFSPHRFVPTWNGTFPLSAGGGDLERSRKGFGAGRTSAVVLRLIPGPQYSKEAVEALTSEVFTVRSADRAALRLDGPQVPGGEILSEGIPIGAIQVPPNGSPILLLSDRGTLGGYSKPALLDTRDLHLAGQISSGCRVKFVWGRRHKTA